MKRRMFAVALSLLGAGFLGGPTNLFGQGLVTSSNPDLARLAESLLPELAERAGLELSAPVRLEERSREELVEYLETKLDEELPPEEAAHRTQAYALLGMVPADLDLREVVKGLYTEQVAGFYEPDSTALFILDDQSEQDLEALLIHELVHAIQDQTVALDELTDPDLGNDRASAAQAALEGHATLVMMEYAISRQAGAPVDFSQLPQIAAMIRQGMAAVPDQFPALASAPRVLRESLVFPYVEGAAYLHDLWLEEGRIIPFGEHLPLSTEQILLGPDVAPPVELELGLPGDMTVLLEDVLGRLELGIFLAEQLGEEAVSLADGWDGDRYALFEDLGKRGIVLVTVWDSVESRDAFVEAVHGPAEGSGGLITARRFEVEGRPASLLQAGYGSTFPISASIRTP